MNALRALLMPTTTASITGLDKGLPAIPEMQEPSPPCEPVVTSDVPRSSVAPPVVHRSKNPSGVRELIHRVYIYMEDDMEN